MWCILLGVFILFFAQCSTNRRVLIRHMTDWSFSTACCLWGMGRVKKMNTAPTKTKRARGLAPKWRASGGAAKAQLASD
jgi:hypothetical protein